MRLPLQISFRNMDPSDAVRRNIEEHAAKLDEYCDQIMSCRVVFEERHQHHHQGKLFHVSIDITVPGEELAVSREPDLNHAHEDAYVAIRDAFNAAQRQLKQYNARRQQHIKHHVSEAHGRVISVTPSLNFGLIETGDGREVYFHRNSVLNAAFDDIEIGDEVRFHEEAGEKGPQASTVKLEGKHHLVD